MEAADLCVLFGGNGDARDDSPTARPGGPAMDLIAVIVVLALSAAAFGWLRLVERA
jgi:hypothetical protein